MPSIKNLVFSAVIGAASISPASAAVYVVAHPDDHILLMGPNMVNDIINGYPTVIVIVTAGDAGNGIGASSTAGINSGQYNNLGNQYYRIRLQGQMYAIDSWIPDPNNHTSFRNWTGTTEYFSSGVPSVERWTLGNVVLYHLNLPDQNDPDGTKLGKLHDIANSTLSDIRGINTYTAGSLKETLRQIISRNNHNTPTLVINFPEPVSDLRDHPDHTYVGQFVQDAINEAPPYKCMYQAIYPGYSLGDISVNSNLFDTQRQGYEIQHNFMLNGGNITPISGYALTSQNTPANWAKTTFLPGSTTLQKGTMDSFHMSFYGKSAFRANHPSDQPCAL